MTQRRRGAGELGAKQPHELLLILGGALAILLSAAQYGIPWATPPGIPTNQLNNVVVIVLLNLVLGGSLFAAAAISRKNLMNGAMVGGILGLLLIYYGAQPGLLGGIVGIIGAILAAAKPYMPWSQREPD
jgi:hypothetical protein